MVINEKGNKRKRGIKERGNIRKGRKKVRLVESEKGQLEGEDKGHPEGSVVSTQSCRYRFKSSNPAKL